MLNIQWTTEDFDVFQIDGLEARMEGLDQNIRPKFHALGEYFSAYFSGKLGEEFFPHVAKHARRTVNPPKDSWVAFAPYKRGYKALPHFQIGLWGTHIFIVAAIIYEAPQKNVMAERLLQQMKLFDKLPDTFILSGDHMSPDAVSLGDSREETLEKLLVRLRDVKKGEFLVGRHLSIEEATHLTSDEFIALTEQTFEAILPIYKAILGQN